MLNFVIPGMCVTAGSVLTHTTTEVAQLSISTPAGEVTHRSRFLRSDTYKSNMDANRIVVSEMGTMAYPDPSKNLIVK